MILINVFLVFMCGMNAERKFNQKDYVMAILWFIVAGVQSYMIYGMVK